MYICTIVVVQHAQASSLLVLEFLLKRTYNTYLLCIKRIPGIQVCQQVAAVTKITNIFIYVYLFIFTYARDAYSF
jgi:hypothetical protein